MHTLPTLPYDYTALEPHLDALTMEIHHTKHHQTYIDKLNAGLEAYPQLQALTAEELLTKLPSLPSEVQPVVRNHGGGHANHSLFWTILSPTPGAPTTKFSQAVESTFGSWDQLQAQVTAAAAGQFGSGWGWLVSNQGQLEIMATANQDSPLSVNKTPLLGIDVWEHAYYLKYQNRRPDYLAAIWSVIDWAEVSRRFEASN